MLVEYLLIDKSFRNDLLIPNKPHEEEVKARLERSFLSLRRFTASRTVSDLVQEDRGS